MKSPNYPAQTSNKALLLHPALWLAELQGFSLGCQSIRAVTDPARICGR